jgi:hypothetical protein
LRKQLQQGLSAEAIAATWAEEHPMFAADRQLALIYD